MFIEYNIYRYILRLILRLIRKYECISSNLLAYKDKNEQHLISYQIDIVASKLL